MSGGTVPIQVCDHENGCDAWMLDYYRMEVANWRDLLGGWLFDPRMDVALCPEHQEVTRWPPSTTCSPSQTTPHPRRHPRTTPSDTGGTMKHRQPTQVRPHRKPLVALVALLFLLAGASTAQAEGYGGTAPFAYHHDYTYGSWDYDYVGSIASDVSSCYPEHTDVYKSRRILCPWCTWYTNTKVHCIVV